MLEGTQLQAARWKDQGSEQHEAMLAIPPIVAFCEMHQTKSPIYAATAVYVPAPDEEVFINQIGVDVLGRLRHLCAWGQHACENKGDRSVRQWS